MSIKVTVLFNRPQQEIVSLIVDRMNRATSVSIVTGFATPGGLAAISAPISAHPGKLQTLVVGAATYPGFEALDDLLTAGVPADRLHVHLGHSAATGGRRNPFARYHPMLHSKVYYMEMPDGNACVFIGSHNVTAFALAGFNGEAAVLLEGPATNPNFDEVRQHIAAARSQAVPYSSGMKEAFAWWTREFLDGWKAEMRIPQDWNTVRTILLFASAAKGDRPKTGDQLYFEIPEGIEQIESLKTETHLFLFDTLPATPWQALDHAFRSPAAYTCTTLGVENKQGNKEVSTHWRLDGSPRPVLSRVLSGTYRPTTPPGMQQVRAEVKAHSVGPFEYLFDRERKDWEPIFDPDDQLLIPDVQVSSPINSKRDIIDTEARAGQRDLKAWTRVQKLVPKAGSAFEKDQEALKRAAPESGSYVLVSLRRRKRAREI